MSVFKTFSMATAGVVMNAGVAAADCRAESYNGDVDLLKRIYSSEAVGDKCLDAAELAARRGRPIMQGSGIVTIQCPGEQKQTVGYFERGRVSRTAPQAGC